MPPAMMAPINTRLSIRIIWITSDDAVISWDAEGRTSTARCAALSGGPQPIYPRTPARRACAIIAGTSIYRSLGQLRRTVPVRRVHGYHHSPNGPVSRGCRRRARTGIQIADVRHFITLFGPDPVWRDWWARPWASARPPRRARDCPHTMLFEVGGHLDPNARVFDRSNAALPPGVAATQVRYPAQIAPYPGDRLSLDESVAQGTATAPHHQRRAVRRPASTAGERRAGRRSRHQAGYFSGAHGQYDFNPIAHSGSGNTVTPQPPLIPYGPPLPRPIPRRTSCSTATRPPRDAIFARSTTRWRRCSIHRRASGWPSSPGRPSAPDRRQLARWSGSGS